MWRVLACRAWVMGMLCSAGLACSQGSSVEACGEIPSAGCPLERGGTCDDPECAALYDCVSGAWQLTEVCEGFGGGGTAGTGGAGGGSGGGTAGTGGTGGDCEGVILDHSQEVAGCTPYLQAPDCEAGLAEICHPCLTGCFDFFMCTAEGWLGVAFCDDDGQVVVEQ